MTRIALGFSLAVLGTFAVILRHDLPAAPPASTSALAIIQIGAQARPDDPAGPVIDSATPPLPTPHDDARQSAIRPGIDTALDPAVGEARQVSDPATDPATVRGAATRPLDGSDRVAVSARWLAAIHPDPRSSEPTTLRF
jgi:hypothetical protein